MRKVAKFFDQLADWCDPLEREVDQKAHLCRVCNRYTHWWVETRDRGWWDCIPDKEFDKLNISDEPPEWSQAAKRMKREKLT